MDSMEFLAPLVFVIVSLVAGAILKFCLKRTVLPYTVGLFAFGLVIGLLDRMGVYADSSVLKASIDFAGNIDPDLILYLFLPILIFDAAYELDVHIFRKTLTNATLLSGPGMVVAMFLTGAMMMAISLFAPNYAQWDWTHALMFGALISATDPVAVVALLKELGVSKRFSTLVDAESMLNDGTGIVLFIFGSGPVQGFATTLIIGIVTSVFTSIFISRIIIDDRLAKGKNITFDNKFTRNFLQNTTINFLSKRKYTYVISSVVIIICIVSMFTRGFTYGVDFAGGRTYVVRFDQPVSVEEVRASLVKEFDGGVEAKQFGGESQMKITTQYMIQDKSSEADAAVEEKLFNAVKDFYAGEMNLELFTSTAVNPNGIISSDKVDASIADDMKRDAIIAVVIALLVIFIYIAIRFKKWTWGLGGTVGLAHTAIIVVGFFSLFSGILPFSLDVDQTFIAAVLTIIGYAINDTVVIFDRIREYKTLHPKMPLEVNANQALNSTLSRTMNTSLTTLIVMVAIAIFGGEVIRGMAVALCLGIAVGTYASIFIATPIMYDVTMAVERKNAKKLAAKK